LGVAGSVFFCPPFFCLPEWLQQKNGGQKNTQVVLVRGMAKDWLIGFRFCVLGFRSLAKAATDFAKALMARVPNWNGMADGVWEQGVQA
jgi:nicotinamide riboside transporter PnuC